MPKIINLSHIPALQADATLSQAAAVVNTWYTALDTTINARIIAASVSIDTANETLEMRFTIDGQTIAKTALAATAGTSYIADYYQDNTSLRLALTGNMHTRTYLLEGRSVKVEVRKTTNNGAGTLTCRVSYAKW